MAGRRLHRRSLIGCACCATAGAVLHAAGAAAAADPHLPTALELGTAPMQRIAPSVWVAPIAPGLWLHSTTRALDDGTIYPANGLLLERPGGAVLIDPGYTPDHAAALLHWAARRGVTVTLGVATHFHSDRTGGIPALRAAGIRAVGSPATCALARRHGMPVPEPVTFAGDVCRIDDTLELFFPGAAHTRDNVVAWLPGPRVLMGGCMIKSVTTTDLGYTTDAVIPAWPASLRHLRARYVEARIVVPGHGTITGDPIASTLKLLTPS